MPEALVQKSYKRVLEVIRDANGGVVDVVVTIGIQVRRRGQTKVGNLGDDTAILCPDIEAGADFVGNARTVESDDGGLSLGIEGLSCEIADVAPEQCAAARFHKGIEIVEVEVVDVSSAHFLGAIVDLNTVGIGHRVVMNRVLGVGIVRLDRATRSKHKAVAEQRSQAALGIDRNSGRTGNEGLNHAGSADANVLTALLGSTCHRTDGEQECK